MWQGSPNRGWQAERVGSTACGAIDALVYDLYGLTEEEIAIVEGRLKHE